MARLGKVATTVLAALALSACGDDAASPGAARDASNDASELDAAHAEGGDDASADGGNDAASDGAHDASSDGGNDAASEGGDGGVAARRGWELDETNTGLAGVSLDCASLAPYTGGEKPKAGAVIERVRITTGLDLSNGGVTLDRVCIQPTSVGQGMPVVTTTDYNQCCGVAPATVTISNSDFDGSKLSVRDAAMATAFLGVADLRNNYLHDFGSGIAIFNAGTELDATVEGNYVGRLLGYGDPATDGNHSDAFTVRDFDTSTRPSRRLVVRNNRFDCDSPNATGAFFIQTYGGPIHNLTMSGNLLQGGGYQLGLNEMNGNAYGELAALDNRFSGTGYGPAYVQGGAGWDTWEENYRDEPSAPEHRGAPVSAPTP